MARVASLDEAFAPLESGSRVYIHGGAATPTPLLEGLTRRARELHDIETVSLHLDGPAPHVAPELEGHIRHNALFIGPNVREAVQAGRADFTPVFLSDIPALFEDGVLPIDVALLQVSPPDAHGFCSLGVSVDVDVDVAFAAAASARHVIAEVNRQMPRNLGESFVALDRFDSYVETERPLHEYSAGALGDVHHSIAKHIAPLIDDGATLQMGIGAVPDAILEALAGHRNLGIHTEMFSDRVVDLVEAGVVTGARKKLHRGLVRDGQPAALRLHRQQPARGDVPVALHERPASDRAARGDGGDQLRDRS